MQGNVITRPGGTMVARLTPVQKAACSYHVRVNILYQFLRVDAFGIILIVICVHARKRHHMRPGGAMVARLTPVQKVACPNHVRVNYLFQFLQVDAFDIISVVTSVHAMKR